MRLGTRWSVGAEPPAGLPGALLDAIRTTESRLSADERSRLRWTLSWLESRPSAELDDGSLLEVAPDGSIVETR